MTIRFIHQLTSHTTSIRHLKMLRRIRKSANVFRTSAKTSPSSIFPASCKVAVQCLESALRRPSDSAVPALHSPSSLASGIPPSRPLHLLDSLFWQVMRRKGRDETGVTRNTLREKGRRGHWRHDFLDRFLWRARKKKFCHPGASFHTASKGAREGMRRNAIIGIGRLAILSGINPESPFVLRMAQVYTEKILRLRNPPMETYQSFSSSPTFLHRSPLVFYICHHLRQTRNPLESGECCHALSFERFQNGFQNALSSPDPVNSNGSNPEASYATRARQMALDDSANPLPKAMGTRVVPEIYQFDFSQIVCSISGSTPRPAHESRTTPISPT